MPSPTRLANKTIWAIEDITAAARGARRALDRAVAHSRRTMDPVLLACLLDLSTELAAIERTARDARQGSYAGAPGYEKGT